MFVLVGCAASNAKVMNSWLYQRDSDLITAWGAPTREVTLSDSSRVMTWESNYRDPWTGQRSCSRSFTIAKSGIVTNWSMSPGCPK